MVTNAGGDASNEPIRNNHREHPIRSTYKSVILHSGTSDVGAVQRRNSGKDLKSSIGGSSVVSLFDAAQVMSEPLLPLKAVCYSRSDCTSE